MWLTVKLHLIGMTAAAGAAWVACATFAAGSARADTPRVPQTAVAASAPVNNDDPTWVIDPAYPGDHLPPVGRSLFDFLVTTQRGNRRETQVPFPFSALIERIEQYLARDPLSALPPAKRVLIPMGRSLQRSAAAPEYFRFPRVVVAVDREPVADDRRSMLLLKDRLYLGYQEKSDLIEVISYNEAAGRFEFQLVKDYRGGATPRVVYANRAVCISCHQNGAPLFSRQVWDETNANPRIAALLAAQRRDFYGIAVTRGVDMPNAIDDATERANRFARDQLIWRDGCGTDDAAAMRCRAALFTAALQYRLSGEQQFARDREFNERAVSRLMSHTAALWPSGLAIGNPDIPNRDPLRGAAALPSTAAEVAAMAGVTAPFDPLLPRPPLGVFRIGQPRDVDDIVAGLGEFIASADVDRLDRQLRRIRTRREQPPQRTECSVRQTQTSGAARRVEFRCPAGQSDTGFGLRGQIEIAGQRITGGSLDELRLADQAPLRDIELTGGRLITMGAEQRAVSHARYQGRSARAAGGEAIERIELAWPRGSGNDSRGVASAILVDDFAAARAAIAALLDDGKAGKNDAFSSRPMRRARLLPALFERFGATQGSWCCLDDKSLPPPRLEQVPVTATAAPDTADANAGERNFHIYCATCHQTAESSPPNFLQGSADRVRNHLGQCAERIYARLSMWRVNPESRLKTPMPPVHALRGMGMSAETWADSASLKEMIAYAGEALKTERGALPSLDALLGQGYDNLRPCL